MALLGFPGGSASSSPHRPAFGSMASQTPQTKVGLPGTQERTRGWKEERQPERANPRPVRSSPFLLLPVPLVEPRGHTLGPLPKGRERK